MMLLAYLREKKMKKSSIALQVVLVLVLVGMGNLQAQADLFDRKIREVQDTTQKIPLNGPGFTEIGSMQGPEFYWDDQDRTIWLAFKFEREQTQLSVAPDRIDVESGSKEEVVIWRHIGSTMLVGAQGRHYLFPYESLAKMPITQKKPKNVALIESMAVEYADRAWVQQLALEARAHANGQVNFKDEITENDSAGYFLFIAAIVLILVCLILWNIGPFFSPSANTSARR